MHRAFAATLLSTLLMALGTAPLSAQAPDPEGGKATDAAKPAKGTTTPGSALDKLKLPPGGVVIVVQQVKDALAMVPKMVLLAPEEYQKLLDRLRILEKKVKAEKTAAHACKLTGHIDGGFAYLRADIAFTTDQNNASIFLGFAGAQFTDEGQLDGAIPFLDAGDDGFFIRVDKIGTHRLAVNLKTPVRLKRATPAGGGGERGFDLSLPGAAVTTLALDLPPGVKEIRWNDVVEKPRTANHWELAVGKVKALAVSWKEPVALAGNAPLLTADSQITVKVEEDHVLLNADLTLEDLRGSAKEWRLLLPPSAKVDVKAAAGVGFDLLYPEAGRPYHAIRLAEPSSERLAVNVQVRRPRPIASAQLAVGPFHVLGTFRQEGIITVLAPPKALAGKRLVFQRRGDVYPRDVPKGPGSADIAGIFKFWAGNADGNDAAAPVPLELKFQADKSMAEAGIDHGVRLKHAKNGWQIDVISTIHLKSRPDFLDVQLPRTPASRLAILGLAFGSPMPAALAWLKPASDEAWPTAAVPLSFRCDDDLAKLGPPDARGIARLTLNRGAAGDIKLVGNYRVPGEAERVRVDLPRLLNVLDRGGTATIKVPDRIELLPRNSATASTLVNKQETRLSFDVCPESIELAWQPYRAPFVVAGVTDIWLHDRSAEATAQLSFTVPPAAAGLPAAPLRFHVPAAIKELTIASGGKLIQHDPAKQAAWILPAAEPLARADITLRYDFTLPGRGEAVPGTKSRLVHVPLVWPTAATRADSKVRVWSDPGTNPTLARTSGAEETWKNHGIEFVPGSDAVPALVLRGSGLEMPLALRLTAPQAPALASVLCDKALIQVTVDDEGNQTYRARYWAQKLNARRLDVEFPMPAADCLVNVWLDQKRITNWTPLEADPNRAHIPVEPRLYAHPCQLEIAYKLPASFASARSSWRSTLYPPRVHGAAILGNVRWHVGLPSSRVGLIPAGNLDYRWSIDGWLLEPEAALAGTDTDSWRQATGTAAPVTLAMVQPSQESVQLWHFSRRLWLLVCSSAVLALGLALFVVPLPRMLFWVVVGLLACGVAVTGLLWPGLIAPLAFGCEPGAFVLALLLGVQWMLHERYRRRLVFMPGFKRLKSDSSLIRASAKRREPSTIDAPTPAGSSAPVNHGLTKGS